MISNYFHFIIICLTFFVPIRLYFWHSTGSQFSPMESFIIGPTNQRKSDLWIYADCRISSGLIIVYTSSPIIGLLEKSKIEGIKLNAWWKILFGKMEWKWKMSEPKGRCKSLNNTIGETFLFSLPFLILTYIQYSLKS